MKKEPLAHLESCRAAAADKGMLGDAKEVLQVCDRGEAMIQMILVPLQNASPSSFLRLASTQSEILPPFTKKKKDRYSNEGRETKSP